MRPSKKFTIRVFVYSAILLYVAGDLWVFHGPLSRKVEDNRPDSRVSIEDAKKQGIVGYVLNYPIYLSQVERATRESLWLRGKSIEELSPEQRRTERLAALNDIIDHELLRHKTRYNLNELPVSDEEIDEAVVRLAARFQSRDEMKAVLDAEGIDSEKELRYRLAARIQQEKYIESRIKDEIAVSEEEAEGWYNQFKESFVLPRRIRARHVFIATLGTEPDVAKAKLEKALGELRTKTKSFEQLASEISEDTRTKEQGGDLGWMTEDRLPDQLAKSLFSMPLHAPQLVRSKIGWHLMEVTDELKAGDRSFDDAKDEVYAALETYKRTEVIRSMREAMRASPDSNIHVYEELIPSE